MSRIAVFASYDSKGCIAPYVVYYLKGLKTVADQIVFIADNDVKTSELDKIKDLVVYSQCKHHGCYDFGSYRRGYEWAEESGLLKDADELIFCNDSCYGPIYPFKDVFAKMEKKDCDFWGMTESYQIRHHLQSYFMVFKQKVFSSESFRSFVLSLERQENFWGYVENYETRLTEYLSEVGFKFSSFCPYELVANNKKKELINPCVYPVTLLSIGIPLVKRKVFINKHGGFLRESQIVLMNEIRKQNLVLYNIIKDDSYELLLDADDKRAELEAKLEGCEYTIDFLTKKRRKHLRVIRILGYTLAVVVAALAVLLVELFK